METHTWDRRSVMGRITLIMTGVYGKSIKKRADMVLPEAGHLNFA